MSAVEASLIFHHRKEWLLHIDEVSSCWAVTKFSEVIWRLLVLIILWVKVWRLQHPLLPLTIFYLQCILLFYCSLNNFQSIIKVILQFSLLLCERQ